MYSELIKVYISIIKSYQTDIIVIDNETKKIMYNGIEKIIDSREYIKFIDDLFRIIRYWEPYSDNQIKGNYPVYIKLIEKNGEYNYYMESNIPNNIDSFYDLIDTLK